MFAHRILLAALAAIVTVMPAGAETIKRVTGELTFQNYPGFAALLRSGEDLLVLDITVPLDNDESEGHLSTFVLDGQFEIAYHSAENPSRIYVDLDFEFVDGRYYRLDGTFVVMPDSIEDGVRIFSLEATDSDDDELEDLKLDDLRAGD